MFSSMRVNRFLVSFFLLMASAILISACDEAENGPAGQMTLENVWVRVPAVEGRPGAGYFTIVNNTRSTDRLLAVEAEKVGRIELHQSLMENGVMKMRSAGEIVIEPGQDMVFKPGGYHAMLFDLMLDGSEQAVPLTFVFEKAGRIPANAEIRPY